MCKKADTRPRCADTNTHTHTHTHTHSLTHSLTLSHTLTHTHIQAAQRDVFLWKDKYETSQLQV
jgi:hypothetical protein